MEFSQFKNNAIKTSYRHGNLYEVGSYVKCLTENKIGKVYRRGPNYVICITEKGEMFRSWITDLMEYTQFNKSGDTAKHRLVGTPEYKKLTHEMTPGSEYDPFKAKNTINKNKQFKEENMSTTVRLSAWMMSLNRFEQIEIASKIDTILIENSDENNIITAIDESFGTERMKDLALEYVTIVSEGKIKGADGKACWKGYKYAGTESGKDKCVKAGFEPEGEIIEGMKQARANVGASTCWDGYKAKGTKTKNGREVPNCVKEDEELEEAKNGLYANIHAKRKRGEAPAKPGHEDYPAKDAFKKAARTAKNEALDPVGKEDHDVDNDGDSDKSDKYLKKRRAAVSAAINSKKMKEGFSDWRSELSEKASKYVEVSPKVEDQDEPSGTFDKNKKLKDKKNDVKEECDCEEETPKDKKVKRVKYADGVKEGVDMKKREDIVMGMKKNAKDFKTRYGDKAKEVMYATATKMSK